MNTRVNAPDMVGIPNPLTGIPAAGYPYVRDPNITNSPADPSTIANLFGWFKDSDFDNVADGTEVAQWYDSSSRKRGANAISAAGSRPQVSRNAINSNMTALKNPTALRGFAGQAGASSFTSKVIWTVFAVVSFSTLANSENNYFSSVSAGNDFRMGINSTGPGDFNLVFGNVGNFRTTTALTVTSWHYIIMENDNDTESVYVDGGAALTWASQPGTVAGSAPTDFRIMDGGGTGNFQGSLAEIGYYDRALTSGERSTLYTYFRTRYNLA